jgi:hypothetical protein
MAITQKQIPSAYSSLNDTLQFVVESDNTAQPNFKFIFEVYRGVTKVATVKLWPYPGTNLCAFNAANIIRSYVNSLSFKGSQAFLTNVDEQDNILSNYEVKYGEEYGSPVTSYLALATSGVQIAYNYGKEFGSSKSISDYVDKYVTDRPLVAFLAMGENLFVPYWNPVGDVITVDVITYDATGGVLTSDSTTTSNALSLLNIGSTAINALLPGLIIGGVAKYIVRIVETEQDFEVRVACPGLYGSKNIVFLNRWGCFESFVFRGKSRKSYDVERKEYGTNEERLQTTGSIGMTPFISGSSNVYLGTAQQHLASRKFKYKLTSEFLTDQEFDWLSQLVCSPVIYLEDSGKYIPVKVTGSSYDYKTRLNDKLNPLEIEIEILKTYNPQYL